MPDLPPVKRGPGRPRKIPLPVAGEIRSPDPLPIAGETPPEIRDMGNPISPPSLSAWLESTPGDASPSPLGINATGVIAASPTAILRPGIAYSAETKPAGPLVDSPRDDEPAMPALPEGKRWALVLREAPNRRLKYVRFLDTKEEDICWVSFRDNARAHERMEGMKITVEVNPDELQGGWRIWRGVY